MKTHLFLISTLLTSLLFVSCSKSPTKTEVRFSFKNIVSNGTVDASLNAGIMIIGHSEQAEQEFSIAINPNDNATHTIPLNNGQWEFDAIAWSSTDESTSVNLMEGDTRCGNNVSMQLNGGAAIIDFKMTKKNCEDSRFGDTKFYDGTNKNFKPLKIVSCESGTYTNVTTSTSCNAGKYQSVQVMLPKIDLIYKGEWLPYENAAEDDKEWPHFINKDFISKCYVLDTNGESTTDIRVPVGNKNKDIGSGFYPMILPHKSTDCGGNAIFDDKPYAIPEGHVSNSSESKEGIFIKSAAGYNYNVAFIMDEQDDTGTSTGSCDLSSSTSDSTPYINIDYDYISGQIGNMCNSYEGQILVGDVFIFKTTSGNYTKMHVEAADSSNFKFRYETYSSQSGTINTNTIGSLIDIDYGSEFLYDFDTSTFSGGSIQTVDHDIYLNSTSPSPHFNSNMPGIKVAKVRNETVVTGSCTGGENTYDGFGGGLVGNPWILCTTNQLHDLAANACNSGHCNRYFKLGTDIDFTGSNMSPIGNDTTAFTGDFNGNGHFINDVIINSSNMSVGFFGELGNGARVYDFEIKNSSISGVSSASYVGGLAGKSNDAVIKNVKVLSSFVTNDNAEIGPTGGLVGIMTGAVGTIENCSTMTDVSGASYGVGGLVGHLEGGTILLSKSEQHNAAGVYSNKGKVGGLIGMINPTSAHATIDRSYANIPVKGLNKVGGFVGFIDFGTNGITIKNSYARGAVYADETSADCPRFLESWYLSC